MARPPKRYRIRIRGSQRDDIDADLLLQALLIMAEDERLGAAANGQPDGDIPADGAMERPA